VGTHELRTPLSDSDIRKLEVGDMVYFSGPAFTCRSRLHRYIFDEDHELPFPTEGRNLLIHTGPIVIGKPGQWELVSFMPTSSLRFEKWGASSVREWGLKAIIGKTTMGSSTAQAMKEAGCVHVCPQCVSPNLWLDSIHITGVYLLKELGSIEAAWQLELDKLGPFLVDMDCRGNNHFAQLDEVVGQNLAAAYDQLGIPEEFEYTRLY